MRTITPDYQEPGLGQDHHQTLSNTRHMDGQLRFVLGLLIAAILSTGLAVISRGPPTAPSPIMTVADAGLQQRFQGEMPSKAPPGFRAALSSCVLAINQPPLRLVSWRTLAGGGWRIVLRNATNQAWDCGITTEGQILWKNPAL